MYNQGSEKYLRRIISQKIFIKGLVKTITRAMKSKKLSRKGRGINYVEPSFSAQYELVLRKMFKKNTEFYLLIYFFNIFIGV